MIDAALLLADGKRLVGVLEDDLRRRSEGSADTDHRLRYEYGAARAANRTGQAYETWRATGRLIHDFTDPAWDTRFLGDLYQDLSDAARKRYALLQTPHFVEAFLLDRTLDHAIDTFGLEHATVIDPTCGSGHFVLGAFYRLLRHWQAREPGTPERELVKRSLAAVAGVDLNPFALSIARFRLLVAALKASDVTRLADAPNFHLELAVGDSLLHGRTPGQFGLDAAALARPEIAHVYRTEDGEALARILGRHYAVVVGNPPYVTVKDGVTSAEYRQRFPDSCRGKYAASVPFTERFLDLAAHGGGGSPAGYVGMITANSFMKREMGKNLVERVLARWDLTHVIDTSGAYIPGHGTPTVILLVRGRKPVLETVRTVMGIRGEPSRPDDPAKGLVWSAIVDQVDKTGSESDYVSVSDVSRGQLAAHPWSIGGGGAAELKDLLDTVGPSLESAIGLIGIGGMTIADDLMLAPAQAFHRRRVEPGFYRPLVTGEPTRDWNFDELESTLFPYRNEEPVQVRDSPGALRWMWPARTTLGNRATFAKLTYFEEGRPWWEWHQIAHARLRTPLSIAFAFVATHNHFVLDRGGKVFNRSAPVIKLPAGATEEDHLGLLGVLNSAPACFWMKQVFHNKGSNTDIYGARVSGTDVWDNSFEFDGTKLKQFPLPAGRPLERARRLDALAQELATVTPEAVCERGAPTREALATARDRWDAVRAEMIALQEELDWEVLGLYGLVGDELVAPPSLVPRLELGQRAFEVVLARRMADGEVTTAWFDRHRSTPITELPADWAEEYRRVVEARIERIETDRDVGLIERPECKRRWAAEAWEDRQQRAVRTWLTDRLEAPELWDRTYPRLRSAAGLADAMRADPEWVGVAAVYLGRPDVDLSALVQDLVADQAVPYLAALRYRESGRRKRAVWERTWELQRAEDRGEDVGTIPVPPLYGQADFAKASYWKLRGKLDVAKERFVSYPGAGRDTDATTLVGWAGWDHREQALALAGWLQERRDADNWDAARLTPLVAGLAEAIPWVRQWHPEVDPGLGVTMGHYLASYLSATLLELGLTAADLAGWLPAEPVRGRRRRPAAMSEGPDSAVALDDRADEAAATGG
ncbi:MAG TPA: BREX-2 system adenine-specific DNA-methyltransferase PglX [Acidimicrobiales bacterium]|jgi:hypothetical protein|nr:BREX-2 system adenine-specific DNA-methyltransferase PglX [Acidimicrobiales bacterium]